MGCGSPPESLDATVPTATPVTQATAPSTSPSASASASPSPSTATPASPEPPSPCPLDMQLVETSYCPDIQRRCLEVEHEHTNHLDICHAFARAQRCHGARRNLSVCVDRYEYPNRAGAHPVWMLDWYEAQATCESKGKRLCSSTEWTAACEGPDHTPFPYGFDRDHRACNMDNFYIEPMRPGPHAQFFFYSKDKDVAFRELSRLDQSVASGSMEGCKSGFGVYDLTGNMDEWVVSDEPPRDKSRWAGLKGGAWGHVRSQCRPMTTSHEPEFRYYFVGFRCCRDVAGAGPWKPARDAEPPPAVEAYDFAPDPILPVDAPGPTKTKFTWVPKDETSRK